jgi:hypothetical protein
MHPEKNQPIPVTGYIANENQPMHPEKTFIAVVPNAPFFLYSRIFRMYEIKKFSTSIENVSKIDPKKLSWYEYLTQTKEFEVVKNSDQFDATGKYANVDLWLKIIAKPYYWQAVNKNGIYEPEIADVIELYEQLKELNKEERKKALEITTANIV